MRRRGGPPGGSSGRRRHTLAHSSLRLDAGGLGASTGADPLSLLLPGTRRSAAVPPPPPEGLEAPDASVPALMTELKLQLGAAVAAEDYAAVQRLGKALQELQAQALQEAPPPDAAAMLLAARRKRPQLKFRYSFDAAIHRGSPKAFPPELMPKFVMLAVDQRTLDFLDGPASEGESAAKHPKIDSEQMTNTDRIALEGTHMMHVLSTGQAARLFGGERLGGTLLDLGAGCGGVTQELAPIFDTVMTTEVSQNMASRLRERGFDCMHSSGCGDLAAELRAHCGGTLPEFRAISLLNVLDRCANPQSLLKSIHELMAPGVTQLLVALVLPFGPFVETPSGRVAPTERLPIEPNCCWETAVASLLRNVLTPMGFEVERVARAPYLDQCPQCGIFELDDALLVLRRAE